MNIFLIYQNVAFTIHDDAITWECFLYHWPFVWGILNTLRPRRNEQHFADDIFKRIFFKENAWISIKISLKFVPKGPVYNIPALVQIMAWRRSGDKPLSEPIMVSLPTHICVTRPQWVKSPVDSPHKGPVMQSFYVFFVVGLNKLLNKLSNCQWFRMLSLLNDPGDLSSFCNH